MSTLTKVFVVLLVILSLILSAGLIVFVNRQENYKLAAQTAKNEAVAAKSQTSDITQEILKVKDQGQALAADLTNQITTLKNSIAERESTIGQRDGQIVELTNNATQLTATNTSLSEALKVAQADIAARQTAFNDLRTADDKVQKQVVEDSNRITELTNALDVTVRHDRYMAEQNTQATTQLAAALELLRKYNISTTGQIAPPGGAINTTPSININGIVRDFKSINGVPYATISLGSAEAVTHGMKFNVVDPTQNRFLGYLTIDTVGTHESTGRLDGPGVNQVRPNVSEVRTQL